MSSLPPTGGLSHGVLLLRKARERVSATANPLLLSLNFVLTPFSRTLILLKVCELPNVLGVKFTDYNLFFFNNSLNVD